MGVESINSRVTTTNAKADRRWRKNCLKSGLNILLCAGFCIDSL
jgi:hypothetical protein